MGQDIDIDSLVMQENGGGTLASVLHQAVQECKASLAPGATRSGLQSAVKYIKQLPSHLHEPQEHPPTTFSAFKELFNTTSSIFYSDSTTAEDQALISGAIRDLLLAFFVAPTPPTPADPTCAHQLLLTAAARLPPHANPLTSHDALLLLFWIDTRLLNPDGSLPQSKSQVTELLERSTSGNPQAGDSAYSALLHGPAVPTLILSLLEVAQGPDAHLQDPAIFELHTDVAAWGAAASAKAFEQLLHPADEANAASAARARRVVVACLEVTSSALRRVNKVASAAEPQFSPAAVKNMGAATSSLLQLGEAVMQAATMLPHEPATSKALLSAAEVYAAARTLVGNYCRLASEKEATELAARLRSQVSNSCWLCAKQLQQPAAANGHSPRVGANGHHAGTLGGSSGALQPWRWDLARPLVLQAEEDEAGCWQLLRAMLEVLAQLAGWCWRGGRKQPMQKVALLPSMLPSAIEQQSLAVLLGRTFHLAGCSDPLARVLLPLLADPLAAQQPSPTIDTSVYATLLWALASMAGASSAGGSAFSWVATQVSDLLIHLYRSPPQWVQESMMGGPPDASRPHRDALVVALTKLAAGMEGAQRSVRHELRRRLLQLFREVGLRVQRGGDTGKWDLGALLPVVAAAFTGMADQWAPLKGLSVKSSHSLDFMEQMQRSQAAIIQMLRELWFHCATLGFTQSPPWPAAWLHAAGIIAAGTPALMVGSGPNRADDVKERLRAELGVVVSRAGASASQAALSQKLAALLHPHCGGLPQPSTQIQAAFLLAIATAEDCRAKHAPLHLLRDTSPLVLPQLYLQTAPTGSEDSAWCKAILQHCCGVVATRLAALRNDEAADLGEKEHVEACAESVAGSLISALADSGGHREGGAPPVVGVSRDLLLGLLDTFPSLHWSRRCLDALLGELEEEEGDRRLGQLAASTTATANLTWAEMRSWLERASTLAPGRTEALLHACLSQITRDPNADLHSVPRTVSGTGVAAAARRRGTELLAACASATQRSELAWLEVMADQGALAMGRKQHCLGIVQAMQLQLEEEGAPTATLPTKLNEELQEALVAHRRKADLEQRYLVAAAYLASQEALPPSHPAIQSLLRTICQGPVQKLSLNMAKVAVFAWTWVSVAAPQLEEELLQHVASAWVQTVAQGVGLFSGRTHLPGEADPEDVREEAEKQLVAGIRCHQQWLTFFVELWNAAKDRGSASQNVIFQVFSRVLHRSLSDVERLSRHPAAVAPRFRLLTLALMYMRLRARHYSGSKCPEAVALLNDRILLAALHWFTEAPQWHHTCTQREATERHLALRDFLSTFHAAAQEHAGRLPTLTLERLQLTLTSLSAANTPTSSRAASRASTPLPTPMVTPLPSFLQAPPIPPPAATTLPGQAAAHPTAAHAFPAPAFPPPFAAPLVAASDAGSEVPPPSPTGSVTARRAQEGLHPVWGAACGRPGDVDRLQRLLVLLVKTEEERLQVWAQPRLKSSAPGTGVLQGLKESQWKEAVHTAWGVRPTLALMLLQRCSTSATARAELETLVAQGCHEPLLQAIPEAAMLLVTPKAAKANAPELDQLERWAPASAVEGLELLSSPAGGHPKVKAYCMRCLSTYPPTKLAFFLPQLVQCIRHDDDGQLSSFLIKTAQGCNIFAHALIWGLMAEEEPPEEARNPRVKRAGWAPPKDFGLWQPARKLKKQVLSGLPPDKLQYWQAEYQYFNRINAISGILKELAPEDRRNKINAELAHISPSREDLYLPGCPESRVKGLVRGSGTPMPSAAKVPILVAFEVEVPTLSRPTAQALIFKVGDDVRQDVLALQVIQVLKDAFQGCGLDLYLRPYAVMPTGYEQGIIEVVPNTKSRSGVGEITEGGLYDYFQIQFGQPGSPRFEAARRAFILSEAGYAIASFLLQCKDRHNGNLLIDQEGHLVHIDFGFILEISPGANMGFESAAFKLSHEMTQLLDPGGVRNSAHFKLFEEYCVRGYLAARTVAEPILAIVGLMKEAGLPCFGRGQPLENLRARFHLELSEAQAAAFIRNAIYDSYQKWTTGFYDYVQYLQNGIPR